jgi:hypothetical protein
MTNFGVIVLIVVAVAFAALLATPVVIAVLRVARRRRRIAASPHLRAEAVVVDKRTKVIANDRGPTDQTYFATFQFPDGNRLELEVPGSESGLLVVGDQGALDWQGPRYLGFAREILR